jgi:hypothetical protein
MMLLFSLSYEEKHHNLLLSTPRARGLCRYSTQGGITLLAIGAEIPKILYRVLDKMIHLLYIYSQ